MSCWNQWCCLTISWISPYHIYCVPLRHMLHYSKDPCKNAIMCQNQTDAVRINPNADPVLAQNGMLTQISEPLLFQYIIVTVNFAVSCSQTPHGIMPCTVSNSTIMDFSVLYTLYCLSAFNEVVLSPCLECSIHAGNNFSLIRLTQKKNNENFTIIWCLKLSCKYWFWVVNFTWVLLNVDYWICMME